MPISKNMGYLRPCISVATKHSITDEQKRQERAKGKETDKLKLPSRSAHVSSTGDNERAKKGINTNDRVYPSKPSLLGKAKLVTSTCSTREKCDSGISTSTLNKDIQDQSLSSLSHSKSPRWEKVDEESICLVEKGVRLLPSYSKLSSVEKVDKKSICMLEKNLRSLSIADRNTLVLPTPQEGTNNESTSSLQADMLFSRSLSWNNERTTESAELEKYDETSTNPNLKLTRSLPSEDICSSLQKPSKRSAFLLESLGDTYSGFDVPTSSNARTYSYKYTLATQEPVLRDNLDFYQGKIKSKPVPGHFIKDMLKWKGDYDTLEWNHLYIQWLFPIPQGRGLNRYAQQLTAYEAEEIKRDDKASKRVLGAYKMMLDFYGMRLADENVGTVKRSVTNWEERYKHLNGSRHNVLRITRIIKSIGELGLERFQFQWVNFLFDESVVNKALPNLNKSCFYHWIDAIHDGPEKEVIYRRMHGLPIEIQRTRLQDTNSESDEEEDIETSKTRDVLEKGATGTSYTPKEVPLKFEQKTNTPAVFVSEPLSENDLKRLSAHKDFSDREVPKDGENVEIRYTALGDKYDAEDDDIHGTSASENDLKRLSAHKDFSDREVPKDGENVERRYTALGDKYDAEGDDIHGASASENDLKRLSAHKDFSDREVPKDCENVERRYTALGDKYDAEDDDIHGASASENDLKRLSAHKDFSDREVPKDGENVERRYTALGDKYDAEDDDIHGASARKKTEKPSKRSASLFEKSGDAYSGFDVPRSSYAGTYSYKYTPVTQEPNLRDNLDFYQGKIKSKPLPGHFIKDMLKWKGDYDMLDLHHQYIQWLFPIPEGPGMTRYAQPLTEYEAEEIKRDEKAYNRVLGAYKMMLDFYGMRLADEIVGTVTRSETNWEERYAHLNRSGFNLRRITRMLKSLGNIGYKRYQVPFVKFLMADVYKKLPLVNDECMIHWIDAIKDEGERCQMHMNHRNLIEEKYVIAHQNDEKKSNGRSLRNGNGTEESILENIVFFKQYHLCK